MGIPKFFRWIGERYPVCSKMVTKHGVPEFDNFYLDMNGIIHQCARSLTSTGEPFTESKIFASIFEYVRVLVEQIKPQKLLFLAIDGVAPRAKVNQQRSRRFRSAVESKLEINKALKKQGLAPLTEDENSARFDSNCITPGTSFMLALGKYLEEAIGSIDDPLWRNIQIVFTDSAVPGEGEHKIMEWIRNNPCPPDSKHCIYGLDADLILLGLLSHYPNVALLREHVSFGGGASSVRADDASSLTFYLLHLCLIREYLVEEFNDLTNIHGPSIIETIIDDFVLLMCLVGNDFLPHLPGLHLAEGVLDDLFAAYCDCIDIDFPLNDCGVIDYQRLATVLESLRLRINTKNSDDNGSEDDKESVDYRKAAVAFEHFDASFIIEQFLMKPSAVEWNICANLNRRESEFVDEICYKFDLECHDAIDRGDLSMKQNGKHSPFTNIQDNIIYTITNDDGTKPQMTRLTIKKDPKLYKEPSIMSNISSFTKKWQDKSSSNHTNQKRPASPNATDYYKDKMGMDTEEQVKDLLDEYCQGLQWNMQYYFKGVDSWSWFYPSHYAPKLEDVIEHCKTFRAIDPPPSAPLSPIKQLMAVLPPASSALLPPKLASLMKHPKVAHFYPSSFETDPNGKKASWEHIVLIPFIDGDLLFPLVDEALSGECGNHANCKNRTSIEWSSTGHKKPIDIYQSTGKSRKASKSKLVSHQSSNFPSLNHIPRTHWTSCLKKSCGVSVFNGQPARGPSIFISIEKPIIHNVFDIVGKSTFVGWPHIEQVLVEMVSDGVLVAKSQRNEREGSINPQPVDSSFYSEYCSLHSTITREAKKRGIGIKAPALVWYKTFCGLVVDGEGVKRRQWSENLQVAAIDLCVPFDPRLANINWSVEGRAVDEEIKIGDQMIYLDDGSLVVIVDGIDDETTFTCKIISKVMKIPSLLGPEPSFISHGQAASLIGISGRVLSKITGSLMLFNDSGSLIKGSNIGMNIKSIGKGWYDIGMLKIESSHEMEGGRKRYDWSYSPKVIDSINAVKSSFSQMFQLLERHISDHQTKFSQIFPDQKQNGQIFTEIRNAYGITKRVRGDIEGQYLSLAKLEKIHDFMQKAENGSNSDDDILQISKSKLLSPQWAMARVASTQQNAKLLAPVTILTRTLWGQHGHIIGIDENGSLRIHLEKQNSNAGDLDGCVEDGWGVCVGDRECLVVEESTHHHPKSVKSKATLVGHEMIEKSIAVDQLFAAMKLSENAIPKPSQIVRAPPKVSLSKKSLPEKSIKKEKISYKSVPPPPQLSASTPKRDSILWKLNNARQAGSIILNSDNIHGAAASHNAMKNEFEQTENNRIAPPKSSVSAQKQTIKLLPTPQQTRKSSQKDRQEPRQQYSTKNKVYTGNDSSSPSHKSDLISIKIKTDKSFGDGIKKFYSKSNKKLLKPDMTWKNA